MGKFINKHADLIFVVLVILIPLPTAIRIIFNI